MPADINSVTVLFGHGIKREEYGPTKKAEVSITAAVADGEDGGLVLDAITALAMNKVAYMLDAPKPAVPVGEPQTAAEPPKTRGRKPKDEVSAPVSSALSTVESSEATAEPAPAETSADGDDWAVDNAETAVTDEQILAATSKRAAELGNRDVIKALINQFNNKPEGQVFKVQDIPAAQRPDYLTKLAALVAG